MVSPFSRSKFVSRSHACMNGKVNVDGKCVVQRPRAITTAPKVDTKDALISACVDIPIGGGIDFFIIWWESSVLIDD